jgi:outer membrane protein insertion porin family
MQAVALGWERMRRLLVLLLSVICLGASPRAPRAEDSFSDSSGDSFGPGFRYWVADVQVRGNRKTDPGLILRELSIAPGDVISADDPRVRAAELRLLSLGFFLRVELRVLPVPGRRGAVILVVETEERGTAVLNALYLGTSEATLFWGGLDVSETNFAGRGIALGAGFVQSTTPTVPEARAGRAVSLRVAGPPRHEGLLLSGSFLYSHGSEFFQAFGREAEVDPSRWRALDTRRLGGSLMVGGELSRTARFSTEGRFETVRSRLPSIRTRDLGGAQSRPIDFFIHEGASRVASVTALLDLDTRSDPVLPARGRRLSMSIEASLPVLGSSYSYAKGIAQGSFYFPAWRDHVVAFHAFAGAILGEAPYFNRFFVGDLNFLLPPRALGLNFATQPSRNFLTNSVAGRRYESFAARTLVEYAVPLWRRRGFLYRGDAFLGFGAFALAGLDDLRARDSRVVDAVPLDLTADLGVKLDTYIGIFTLSIANGLGRIRF